MSNDCYTQCVEHLSNVEGMDVDTFSAWWKANAWTVLEGQENGAVVVSSWVKIQDEDGDTLLHNAIYSKSPDRVVLEIVATWPRALKVKNTINGNTPLHVALENSNVSEHVLLEMVARNKKAAKVMNNGKNTPLHFALANAVGEPVVLALLEAWPDATAVSNEYDFTPLHIAVSTFENATTVRSSTKVLVAIINASPAAVQRKGGDVDKTPLHIALLPRQTVDDAVVLAMIKSCPAAVQVKDSEHGTNTRSTLLRAVIERSRTTIPSEAVMLALIDAWPDAVKMKGGDKGNVDDPPTPLLLAVARDAPDAIVIAMLNRCPASARVKDSLGRTALHYTLSGPTSDAFATAVFNAWPEAALEVATTHNSRGWSKGRFSWHGSPHEAGLQQSHQIQRKQGEEGGPPTQCSSRSSPDFLL